MVLLLLIIFFIPVVISTTRYPFSSSVNFWCASPHKLANIAGCRATTPLLDGVATRPACVVQSSAPAAPPWCPISASPDGASACPRHLLRVHNGFAWPATPTVRIDFARPRLRSAPTLPHRSSTKILATAYRASPQCLLPLLVRGARQSFQHGVPWKRKKRRSFLGPSFWPHLQTDTGITPGDGILRAAWHLLCSVFP